MKFYLSVMSCELRKIMAYRSEFWMTFLGQVLVQVFVARALWENIFESSGKSTLQGFTLEMMSLYYLILPIGQRVLQGEGMGFLSREIYEGTFSRYLTYPISFFSYKTLTSLTISFFYLVQLFIIIFIYQTFFSDISVNFSLSLVLSVISIYTMAALCYLHLSLMLELLALWADNVWSLAVMLRFFTYFLGGSFIPVDFFPAIIKSAIHYTPFPSMISLPAKTLMGLTSSYEQFFGLLILLSWTLVFKVTAHLIWRRGQFRYTGVGM
jgi:ABC-2 type transport system permease protein